MADISKIALPDGSSYDLISKQTYGVFRGAVDDTSTSTAFTATISGITQLYDGLTISLKNTRVNSAARCTLNINNLGAKTVWASQLNAALTVNGFPKDSEFLFTYDYANDRWIKQQGSSTINTDTIGEYGGACIAGPGGIVKFSLAMKVDETHWESLVTSSSFNTTKTRNTHGFLIDSPIIYQNDNNYINGNVISAYKCWLTIQTFDTRYTTNAGSAFSSSGSPFYLVMYFQDGKLYLAETWWADSLPNLSDNNIYIYVGQMRSSYDAVLYPYHPMYKYINGSWKQVFYADLIGDAATVNGHTVNADVPADANFTNYWQYNSTTDCIELVFPSLSS